MPLPETYRAIVQQQRQLVRLVQVEGVGPIRRMYESMLADITRKLREVDAGTFTEVQLRGMLGQLRIGLEQVTRAMTGQLGDASFQVGLASARATLESVARMEQSLGGVFVQLPMLEVARLRGLVAGQAPSLVRFHTKSMNRYGAHLVSRFEQTLQTALVSGETGHQAIDRVMQEGDLQWYQAERIVRTELAYAANANTKLANEELAAELDGDLWNRWTEHVSDSGDPYDDRVAEDSIAMHGQVAPPGGVFTQPPATPQGERVSSSLVGRTWDHPPNRPNDRAVLTAWRPHWGVPGWIWRSGQRVIVTPEIADEITGRSAPEPAPEPAAPPAPSGPPKNPRRVEAAKKAGEVSAERRREIHSAARDNLPVELRVAWDAEGHKFMREENWRIKGEKDRVNAASKLSQAFIEKYGSGEESAHGNEGDRFYKRAELEAQHAETWADEQERKWLEAAREEALRNGVIDENGEMTGALESVSFDPPTNPSDDEIPF